MKPVLRIRNLEVEVQLASGTARVLDDISIDLHRGRTHCIVGESGCGKSMTALAAMGLLPDRFAVTRGEILLGDENLVTAPPARLRALRGSAMSMIFQEPMTSLNPVLTIERQITEVIELHQGKTRAEARDIALEMLRAVQISSPEERLSSFPHEFSGGMRQRVMIAMALACRPQVIIADEPTTALDVTVQMQIFRLLKQLQSETDTALMLITHDLGAVAKMADDVSVLYAGKCVETGPVEEVLRHPSHPYMRGLLQSTPRLRLGRAARVPESQPLREIPGVVPPLGKFPKACPFAPRCHLADTRCHTEAPGRVELGAQHAAFCWKPAERSLAHEPA